ncbi:MULTISPECIES: trigger factor [unclassified Frigoribacterium]|uniref:trigger factor n=1 Tax=unclassified Frigoribacterium TaxID=2627005 RepID=UPI0006FD188B|nr:MULTISPECIES: trigger factor [unclassified Frigoribacterium]KQM24133.1 trigger factor [Frigoribacterium sp. Leaf8]MBD8141308.1 trigger factor [Frigoribacterium sp. CFBP 13605]MBD8484164.1 trigger factor [Frigoribacterium sp. CFBP 8759]NQW88506.1 trigger factor [Frigoribacterium sp. VKM Ac-2860]NQX08685.1 trigger factor [Frigoribacterium sp. VKM Ac-2859]
MVQTTVEKLSPTRVKLNIVVTPDELKPSVTHAYGHIAESVNIPGFRKGKVPPPIIDQRVGREEVLNHAVSESLDKFYREAVTETEIRVLGRPEADVVEWPNVKDFSGDLKIAVEVDVRPDFDLPEYDGLELTVDTVDITDDEIAEELTNLRTRFGTLVTVDRPATTGDFAQIDLTATIGDDVVDTAKGISYELGSGELIEGIDEALESLTAGESTTFESKLLGGDREGETALIAVDVTAVKERELPEADDDFAQIASQFDTIDELKGDLKEQLAKSKTFGQGAQARDQVVEKLLEAVEIPVPEKLVEDEVHRHLEQENRLEDDEHRAEVKESSEKAFRNQILLDAIAEKEAVKVEQDELTQYLIQGAAQYGMEPGEFIKVLDQNGQIPAMVGEVARSKALAVVLSKAKVVDGKGDSVDLSAFTATAGVGGDDDDHAGHDHA